MKREQLGQDITRLAIVGLLLLALSSCVRYYPSREEMNRPFGEDPSIEYVGEKAFYLYDVEQRKRLEKLIQARISNSPSSWDTSYSIGAGDKIQIEVKNFEEVSKEYRVNLDGIIKLPFVGNVEVQGMTEEQLSNSISKIVQDFVLEPQVHVEVTEHSAHKVWVVSGDFVRQVASSDGENVSNSRAYPLRRPNYSLVELLVELGYASRLSTGGVLYLYPQGALHGGEVMRKEDLLKARRVTLQDYRHTCSTRSKGWATAEKEDKGMCSGYSASLAKEPIDKKYHSNARIMIDLEELFGGNHQPPLYVPLRPGDAIYLPSSPVIQVFGEVNRRGSFRANLGGGHNGSSGGTVKPTLMSVLAEAHGLTYAADIHNFEIYRELEYGKKVVMSFDFEKITLRGTQDLKLRDGDIIWVPSKSGRFIEEHSINAINQALGAGNNVYTTATN